MREAVVGLADVREAAVVEQDLLQDERGHGLAQLRARLHDAQAQRNDLGGEQEGDHLLLVRLDQRPNHAQTGQAQVLERTGLGGGVQERVEEERDVRLQEDGTGLGVAGHALQQGEGVAHAIGLVGGERGRIDRRVDVDDLLQEGGRGAEAVP